MLDIDYMLEWWMKLELQAVDARRTADQYKLKIIEEVQRAQAPTDEKESENGINRATLQYPDFPEFPAFNPALGIFQHCVECPTRNYCLGTLRCRSGSRP